MLCCLLCLTVCVVPALAGNEQYTTGFLSWSHDAALLFSGPDVINVLNGYFPASFDVDNLAYTDSSTRTFGVLGSALPHTSNTFTLYSDVNFYVDVLFSAPIPMTVTTSGSGAVVGGWLGLTPYANSGSDWFPGSITSHAIELNIDGSLSPLTKSSSAYFSVPAQTFDVNRYWGYRFHFVSFSQNVTSSSQPYMRLRWDESSLTYTFSDPKYQESMYNELTVNTGILQEINGTLKEIQTSSAIMQKDISEIKTGLQDSNSSIWQSFKDSVSALFVPSSQDLESLKKDFDSLAETKLGGAYQAFEYADLVVDLANNKLKNPGPSPGVEFPGISVPLGGDVGTVTLAASQTVTIPEKITEVLYPVAGVIIPIVCVIWTIRQCTDMVECFMSGMSYAEFLHRNSDREDDEV